MISGYDIFHLLGTDKGRCKTTLAQNTHNHLNRLLYLMKINVEPYLEEADENSYLFFLNDISSQF
jgi:hypothetical protein